jgi:hypothetical protein
VTHSHVQYEARAFGAGFVGNCDPLFAGHTWDGKAAQLQITVRVDGDYVYIEQVYPPEFVKLGGSTKPN